MQRRTVITAVGTAGLVGLAGCSGVTGDFTYTAAPATLDSAAASDAGYETEGPSAFEITETVDVGGDSREINVTTWTAAYSGESGPVIVSSTPNVTVLGQSLNPLARLSGSELISRLLEEFGSDSGISLNDLEAAGQTPVTVFEKEATIQEFTATVQSASGSGGPTNQFGGNASGDSGSIPVRIYLLSVTHEYSSDSENSGDGGDGNDGGDGTDSDVIFTLAVQPQAMTDSETIYDLFGSLQHPVEPPTSASGSNQ